MDQIAEQETAQSETSVADVLREPNSSGSLVPDEREARSREPEHPEDGSHEEEVATLNIPVKQLSKSQRERILEEFAEHNNHPYYIIKKNRHGVVSINKRKQSVEQELHELHPQATLSPTQLLQAQIINLERKYIELANKHKKLKKRVNIIDSETIVIDDDIDLTAKSIPEPALLRKPDSSGSLVPDARASAYALHEEIHREPRDSAVAAGAAAPARTARRSLKSLFR